MLSEKKEEGLKKAKETEETYVKKYDIEEHKEALLETKAEKEELEQKLKSSVDQKVSEQILAYANSAAELVSIKKFIEIVEDAVNNIPENIRKK